MYAVVKLLHHGVALAAVGYQLVALQLQGVVLVYLPLHGGVADARPRGDEVTAFRGVGEVLLDEPRQFQLGLLLQRVGAVGLCLAHVAAGQRADVHHLVVLLERFQLGLHAAKLPLDDEQALVDELGGVHRHLVLVVDGFLVIHVHQRVQHVLGTQGRAVLQREHEDGRLVLLLPDSHAALEASRHGVQRVLDDVDLAARPRLAPVVGTRHQYPLAADGQRVVQPHLIALPGGGQPPESGKRHRRIVLGRHHERDVPFGQQVDEGDVHRRQRIELVHAQPALHTVVHVGVQALHHLAHQPFGTELENLVGHVHLVDIVVVAVEPRRGGLVGRVLDDDRDGAEEHQRGFGVVVPRHPPEKQHGQHEPLPLRQQIDGQVH